MSPAVRFPNEMAETEEDKLKVQNAGRQVPSRSSSSLSEGRAFTETPRVVTEVGKSRVGEEDRATSIPAQ